eukprot:scaffold13709_cov54-Cylindrotheca_fusiformis.AAC.3
MKGIEQGVRVFGVLKVAIQLFLLWEPSIIPFQQSSEEKAARGLHAVFRSLQNGQLAVEGRLMASFQGKEYGTTSGSR